MDRLTPERPTAERLTPEETRIAAARRRQRALVTALLLGAMVVLIFAIAISKIRAGHA